MLDSQNRTKGIIHPFAPVANDKSIVLILGSFPSVQSRKTAFYYGHPQNRFWKLMASLLQSEVPVSIDEKKTLLLTNHIALWDVVKQCDIIGSADSTLRADAYNDIPQLIKSTSIRYVYANGQKAGNLYTKHIAQYTDIPCTTLPSTSAANAAYSIAHLETEWKVLLQAIHNH